MQPDPTNTGTLRPKWKPLLKTGDAFIPMDVPDFSSEVILPQGKKGGPVGVQVPTELGLRKSQKEREIRLQQ